MCGITENHFERKGKKREKDVNILRRWKKRGKRVGVVQTETEREIRMKSCHSTGGKRHNARKKENRNSQKTQKRGPRRKNISVGGRGARYMEV